MIPFGGNPLDRAGERRADPAWMAAQHAAGLFLPFRQNRPLLRDGRAVFLSATQFVPPPDAVWVFLGLEGAQPLFAIAMGEGEDASLAALGEFHEMRAAAFLLPARDTAIAGQAKALLDWHARHRFCPNCGAATDFADGGYRRICPACGAEHFPRTDPVVIMLPVFKNDDGEEACLVGRNARFVDGLYSAFAGFVEPGETVEEAVRRELREEASLTVGAVRYHASQPWPFPSSLMLGCYAEALSRDFRIDGQEIADARWLSRGEARARLAHEIEDDLRLPTTIAIAHRLIRDWVEQGV